MKSLPKLRVATLVSGCWRFLQCSAFGGVALASLFVSSDAFGQGAYYPVSPQGAPYGLNDYTGITVHSNVNLQYLQTVLQSMYPTATMQVPVPTNYTAVTTQQYTNTVALCIYNILNPGSATIPVPAGVTLVTLSNEAVGWNPSALATTSTAIAQTIIANSANSTVAINNLISVANGLALAQPTLIDSIMPSILSQAGLVTTVAQPGIAQLVSTAITDIPTDMTRTASIVTAGLTAINNSSLPLNGATGKTSAFIGANGYVQTLLSASEVNNNPATISVIVKGITYSNFLGLVPPTTGPSGQSSLTQILDAAVAALPTVTTTTMGALTEGALISQGGSASAIATALAAANPGTASYTNAVVYGYSNSATLAAFQTAVTTYPSLADALASGATVKQSLTPAVIVRWALADGTSTNPTNVVAATVGANQPSALATLVGAINTTGAAVTTGAITTQPYTPWGNATFYDLAYGGAEAAALSTAGSVGQTILQNSSSSVTTIPIAAVQGVVQGVIQGATAAGSNNAGALAALIYGAETEARNTSGASAALVTTAINNLTASNSYIAVVAALAGDAYGANRTTIQTTAYGTSGVPTLTSPGLLQSTQGDYTAAYNGATLVQEIQTTSSKTYSNTIAAFTTANAVVSSVYVSGVSPYATPADSVTAVLYGAVLSDPTEYSSELATAIKQTPAGTVPDATLTAITDNALLSSNPNLAQNVAMVYTVVKHLKAEAVTGASGATGIGDLFDYVGHQIVLNPSLTQNIAIAATVLDPDNAHFIAHSVAFNNPGSVSASVASIFTYAQITNPNPVAVPTSNYLNGTPLTTKATPGPTLGAIVDQPAAAAAITAGLTAGILEANLPTLTTQSDLIATISAAVAASITQNATNLQGPLHPFYNSSVAGDSTATFSQSNGNGGVVSGYQTVGAAGAITGYIAQVTQLGNTTISPTTSAVLTAAVGGGARLYALAIAQAAGQALAWVGNGSLGANGTVSQELLSNPITTPGVVNNAYVGNPAYDIAVAMANTVTGFATLAQLETAATYGINQAAQGIIGAGALGLNANGINTGTGTLTVTSTGTGLPLASGNTLSSNFYQVHSATGTPVTDIFNL